MQTGTLAIGGNAASECGSAWSTTETTDDTLTLTPSSSWTTGSGRTLTIDCRDLEDYSMTRIDVSFGVVSEIVYVHADIGSDSYPGTQTQPKKTLSKALELADYLYDIAEVHAAEGTYLISDEFNTYDGVSLYGGYSADDWNLRENDPLWAVSGDFSSSYPTIITGANVYFVIHCSNISSSVTIDGFEINGGTGDLTTGVYCTNSSPVISSMKINGGLGPQSTAISLTSSSNATIMNCNLNGGSNGWSGGILNDNSSPAVSDCLIDGGTSGTGGYTFGISNISSSPLIRRNEINGGDAWGQATGIINKTNSAAIIRNNTINGGSSADGSASGIVCESSSPVIRNNTICGGSSEGAGSTDSSEGLFIYNDSIPVIENNIVFSLTANNRIGIYAQTNSAPAALRNNNIFDCPDALYSGSSAYTAIATLETALGVSASGNISSDLADGSNTFFIDESANWHLTSAAAAEVRQGGLDGAAEAWSFTADIDGITRTNLTGDSPTNSGAGGWSMGAFEKD